MGEMKDSRAIEALEKVARDDYPLARIQAKASLVAMGRGRKKDAATPQPQEQAGAAEEPSEQKAE
jgi:hypothetical protein